MNSTPEHHVEHQPTVTHHPEPTGKKPNKAVLRYFGYGFGGFVVLVIIASFAYGAYRAKAQSATDGFTLAVAKVLNLKAASVNGTPISYVDYADDLKAIHTMWEYDKSHNGPSAAITSTQQLSDQVLFRQASNIIIDSLAKKYSITVTNSDIDDVKKNILIQQFKTLPDAEKAIKDRYGWDFQTFTDKVIRPFVIQNKLSLQVKNNTSTLQALQKQANDVLTQIKGGADFASMAKKYGQDGTASGGGELGWFGKGDMVPEFETAAFALKKGQLSPTIVTSSFGYHIIQVEDKRIDKVKDAKGRLVSKDMVKARHILFVFPSIDKLMSDSMKSAVVKIYANIHNPFLDQAKQQ